MVIGVPGMIEYVRTVMVAKTVALPETEEMSGLGTDKASSVKYATLCWSMLFRVSWSDFPLTVRTYSIIPGTPMTTLAWWFY